MGTEKYLRKVENLFNKSPVVSFSSIQRIIKDTKNTEYGKQLIRNLALKGKIKKLAKGCYTAHDNPECAVFCFRPAYLGLQDALSLHNLWEQETIPVIITVNAVRQGIRKIINTNVLIRRIDPKYFFGIEYKALGDIYYPYSDIEKTFIDMLYFREKVSNDVLASVKQNMDKKKLAGYLKKYPRMFQNQVEKLLK
jgi:predicted transcriptional regulator of viral defense system